MAQADKKRPPPRSGVPTIEQEEAGRVAQQDFFTQQAIQDRMRQHRREDAADASRDSHLALALANFHRAAEWRAEDKAEARQKRIAEAFAQLGRSLGGGRVPSVGGGGSSGGGQDASAFRLPPKPQRTPPRIPQIKKRGD
jgi:hypothetical protein